MKVYILLLDGVGVGSQPDSSAFGDEGANTLEHVLKTTGVHLPNLAMFGLLRYSPGEPAGLAAGGKLQQFSAGKDTISGHWELMGVVNSATMPVYPGGFPEDIVRAFENRIGRNVIGNIPASGTEILVTHGPKHMETGNPILYTSADSVFQLAAHEDVIPLDELYQMCRLARDEILVEEHAVGRVIARPFTGKEGSFVRTANRRDFSLRPPHPTVLDVLVKKGYNVMGIGKLDDIFGGTGFTEARHTRDNEEGLELLLESMKLRRHDLVFVNLVQFDSHWGHRRDPDGFALGLKEVDEALPDILDALGRDDILIITADHGCDPTFHGTDHTREFVPCLFYGRYFQPAADFGAAPMVALADTLAEMYGIDSWHGSQSLVPMIIDRHQLKEFEQSITSIIEESVSE